MGKYSPKLSDKAITKLIALDCDPGSYLAHNGSCVGCPDGKFSSSGSTHQDNCE